ncbi:MAG: bifunctional [glutamate--ammonia ligase]-adenylyl-L-tyrosine phosphorylase/[glutamate--ammonia-ligase] adenylyltransferase [Arenimonas sp.]
MTDESPLLENELQALVQRHMQRLLQANTGTLSRQEIEKKYSTLALVSDFAIDTLCQQPDKWHELEQSDIPPLNFSVEDDNQWPQQLRRWRRLQSTRVVWRDLHEHDNVEASLGTISDIADLALSESVRAISALFTTRYGAVRNAGGESQSFVVFGLGKLGGGELNFSSDVDLVYAYPQQGESDGARSLDSEAYFTRLGQRLAQLLGDITGDGFSHRVDLRLRPYGNSGRLVLSFSAMEHYFQTEGRDWERYAWVKARPVAGDIEAGERCLESLRPFVYRRYLDYTALDGLREMKAMIAAEVEKRELADHLKLGPGGIREIEFLVQALQLIHGGREPALRQRSLLRAMQKLVQAGHLAEATANKLKEAYLFLRRVENRVQMLRDEQTHSLPQDALMRYRIARGLNYANAAELENALQMHRDFVSEEFSNLLASKRHKAKVSAYGDYWRGLPDQSNARQLSDLGFNNSEDLHQALLDFCKHSTVQSFNEKVRARLDHVLPLILEAAAKSVAPEAAMTRSLSLLHAIAKRTSYLALLEEKPAALQRLVDVVARSAWLSERLVEHPLLLDELLDHRVAQAFPDHRQLKLTASQALAIGDTEQALQALNEMRQSLSFRIAQATLFQQQAASESAEQLALLAEVILQAVLELAKAEIQSAHGAIKDAGLAIIGYGSVGAKELGFASDLDLVFLHNASASAVSDGARSLDASRYFARLAQKIISLMQTITPAGRLYEVDMRLRPDGAKGLLVSSLDSFEEYQRERAWTWEHQALVRSRSLAGDDAVRARFEQVRTQALQAHRDLILINTDVSAMRLRMRNELDRSTSIRFDLKQGLGGLVDMEFFLQARVMALANTNQAVLKVQRSPEILAVLKSIRDINETDVNELHAHYENLIAHSMICSLDQRPRIAELSDQFKEKCERVLKIYAEKGLDFNA